MVFRWYKDSLEVRQTFISAKFSYLYLHHHSAAASRRLQIFSPGRTTVWSRQFGPTLTIILCSLTSFSETFSYNDTEACIYFWRIEESLVENWMIKLQVYFPKLFSSQSETFPISSWCWMSLCKKNNSTFWWKAIAVWKIFVTTSFSQQYFDFCVLDTLL